MHSTGLVPRRAEMRGPKKREKLKKKGSLGNPPAALRPQYLKITHYQSLNHAIRARARHLLTPTTHNQASSNQSDGDIISKFISRGEWQGVWVRVCVFSATQDEVGFATLNHRHLASQDFICPTHPHTHTHNLPTLSERAVELRLNQHLLWPRFACSSLLVGAKTKSSSS